MVRNEAEEELPAFASLDELAPPADFSEADAPTPLPGAFALLLEGGRPSEEVGRILGGGDRATEERWAHLAGDAAACEASGHGPYSYPVARGPRRRQRQRSLGWAMAAGRPLFVRACARTCVANAAAAAVFWSI